MQRSDQARPLRIVQLVTRRQRRGAEVFATQLADILSDRGHRVTVVGLFPPPDPPLRPVVAGVEDLPGERRGPLSPAKVGELRTLLRRLEPDTIQANGSDTLKYAVLVKRTSAARWPLLYRNIGTASDWIRSPAQRAWSRWLVRAVDHVASVTEETARDFERVYAIPAGRISTIPIGVDVPPDGALLRCRERLAAAAGLDPNEKILIHVGSFTREKNHSWMLGAFAEVLRDHPVAKLVLVGEGPLQPQVADEIASRGLHESVRLLGARGDAPDLIGGADLLLLPSLTEGLPGVVLEAGARSVPVVASDVGGLRTVVHDGTTGRLVRVGDRRAFVAAVSGMLRDRGRRLEMGGASRTLVRGRYALDKVATEFERLHRRLIGACETTSPRATRATAVKVVP